MKLFNFNKINAFELKRFIKIILLLLALLVSIITLFLSQKLVNKIAAEETKKMEIWADAERYLAESVISVDLNTDIDLNFQLNVIKSNTTIPAILVNEQGEVMISRNITNSERMSGKELQKLADEFGQENEPIIIPIDEKTSYKVFYGKSMVLKQLEYYPYVVLAIVALFMLVSYAAFSFSTRSEQNQVWVGLAKETAHQLGTPISSLMGWVDCLEMNIIPENAPEEMRKDIDRLKIITERFSKIGSEPILTELSINDALTEAVEYMRNRTGSNVKIYLDVQNHPITSKINVYLFNWVVENLIKNSVDAMAGEGELWVRMNYRNQKAYIDFTDTGKGIPRNQMKDIFKPGFTTKKRGWGLGLSLAKRIIEDYHKGQIFVRESIPFTRTTIRIMLQASKEN